MKRLWFITCVCFICLTECFISCRPYAQVSTENIAPTYDENFTPLMQSMRVVHVNDSLSLLKIKLVPANFLYIRDKATDPFMSSVSIRLLVFDSFTDSKWIDSASLHVSFQRDSLKPGLPEYAIPLHQKTGNTKVIYVSVQDLHKDVKHNSIITFDKTNRFGPQWFEPDSALTRIESVNMCTPLQQITFSYFGDQAGQLKCMFYNDSFSIPEPPFMLVNAMNLSIKPDSVFVPEAIGKNIFSASCSQRGLYFFTADPDQNAGFTVLCGPEGFPYVDSHESMIRPIRYISTQKEFKHIAEAQNKVAAIEDFWLKVGAQEDHASNLIRKYYSRVMNANRLFSSYTEGWQTDRGMIYVVFGPPNIVYRSDQIESWIYGEENNFYSISFTFQKVKNKFTENDYFLQRTPIYKDNWYRAVDIWRQ